MPWRTRERGAASFGNVRRMRSRRSDRKKTRLNSSHSQISYDVFCLKTITTGTLPLAYQKDTSHFNLASTVMFSPHPCLSATLPSGAAISNSHTPLAERGHLNPSLHP